MTTRVTEGNETPSVHAPRGLAAQRSRAHALPLLNLKKKRGCSQCTRNPQQTTELQVFRMSATQGDVLCTYKTQKRPLKIALRPPV